MKDCVIVGGGPAGLTAGLYLARFLRDVTVFDAHEGRALMIPRTHNLAPFPDGISGRDLLDRMRANAVRYGATLTDGTVTAVNRRMDAFRVTTDRGDETARTVIFACGVVNHRPPLPVGDHDLGLSRGLIRYCPVCDAFEVRGKRIAVLGSEAHGIAEARFMRRYSPTVTLIPCDGSVAIASDGVEGLAAPMRDLALSESEAIVTLENGEARRFDTLYVALGTTSRKDLAASLGVRLSDEGCIVTDLRQNTNMEGVYAIGDVAEGLDQIAHAMGQGAVAATAIHNRLLGAG